MERLIVPIISTVVLILIGIAGYIIFTKITTKEKEKAKAKAVKDQLEHGTGIYQSQSYLKCLLACLIRLSRS